jgi:hypothetical protein
VRLNNDGTLDTTFTVWAGVNGQIWSFVEQSDGKILMYLQNGWTLRFLY